MKVAFDAGVLGMVLFPSGPIPNDFRTGKPIDRARERVQSLIEELNTDTDEIVLPAPALAEALVPVADKMDLIVADIESQRCFNVAPFDKKAAIEVAIRTKGAVDSGDKKEGLTTQWQKIKYDRQIVAIAKTEGVTVLYSVDEDVHKQGKLWGIQTLSVADIPVPTPVGTNRDLFEGLEESAEAPPAQPSNGADNIADRRSVPAPASNTEPIAAPPVAPADAPQESQINASIEKEDPAQ